MPRIALLATLRWDHDVVAVRRYEGEASVLVGDDPTALAPLPEADLGVPRRIVATLSAGTAKVLVCEGDAAVVSGAEGDEAPAELGEHVLRPGEHARLGLGRFRLELSLVDDRLPSARAATARRHAGALASLCAAAGVHVAVLVLGSSSAMALDADDDAARVLDLQSYIAAAERRSAVETAVRGDGTDFGEGARQNDHAGDGRRPGGKQAAGASGSAGSALSRTSASRRFAVAKERTREADAVGAARGDALFAQTMVGLLADAPASPRADWGAAVPIGPDPFAANGSLWGRALGEAAGSGGLGLSGTGIGGGGDGTGIGLGSVGTLGHGAGLEGAGTGGEGSPLFRARFRARTYKGIYCGGYGCSVSGRLPPEAVRKVVRANFGRFRLCYEHGLRANPALAGRVAVRFVIGRDGSVSSAADGGSSVPDPNVVTCIVRAFYGLSFPQPEGGIVTVTYPLLLSPPDDRPGGPSLTYTAPEST